MKAMLCFRSGYALIQYLNTHALYASDVVSMYKGTAGHKVSQEEFFAFHVKSYGNARFLNHQEV